MTPVLLIVVVVGGNLLTAQLVPSAAAIQHATGLGAVPWPVQATVAVLASSVAVVLAFRAPALLWPLFVVAAVLLVLRGQGATLFAASYCAGLRLRRLPQVGVYVTAAAALVFAPQLAALDTLEPEGVLGSLALFIGVPVVLGQWIGARHEVVAGLRARAAQHEREREMRAQQAKAEERARIAGDMHDVVAHRVSLMVLYAGALEAQGDPRTTEMATLIRTTGREALTQLREVLGVLKSSDAGLLAPQPALREIDDLVLRSRAAGLDVRRVDEGAVRELPVVVQQAAYRVVQEALTNVHKHAGPVATEVRLTYLPDAVELAVVNAATADPVVAMPGSGSGLVGMRERVELLGGRFTAQSRPGGGFGVAAWLPAGAGERP